MAGTSPSMGWFKTLQQGQQYLTSWPMDKSLGAIFPEYRICRATHFGIRYMPPIAIFVLCWQITMSAQLGPSLAAAIFACSLPLQGLFWLGKRAQKPLPPGLVKWYQQLQDKLYHAGKVSAKPEGEITYQALAELLKRAFRELDKSFLREL